jgi:hypothetical protein
MGARMRATSSGSAKHLSGIYVAESDVREKAKTLDVSTTRWNKDHLQSALASSDSINIPVARNVWRVVFVIAGDFRKIARGLR